MNANTNIVSKQFLFGAVKVELTQTKLVFRELVERSRNLRSPTTSEEIEIKKQLCEEKFEARKRITRLQRAYRQLEEDINAYYNTRSD